jgi:hypothetical protein
MRHIVIGIVILWGVTLGYVGYVQAQPRDDFLASVDMESVELVDIPYVSPITWPDRAALVDWIDNEPEAALQAIEAVIDGMDKTAQQPAIDTVAAGVTAWEDAEIKGKLGSDAVIDRSGDDIVITLPKAVAAVAVEAEAVPE